MSVHPDIEAAGDRLDELVRGLSKLGECDRDARDMALQHLVRFWGLQRQCVGYEAVTALVSAEL